jgi:hypothetical protein
MHGHDHSVRLAKALGDELKWLADRKVRFDVRHLQGGLLGGNTNQLSKADHVVFTGVVYQSDVDAPELEFLHGRRSSYNTSHLTSPKPINDLARLAQHVSWSVRRQA